MPSDFVALLAFVFLAFPMACFLLSSPAFLLVGLDVPEVTQLLRGMINGYFLAIVIGGALAVAMLAVAGRPVFAVGAIAIAVFAVVIRRLLLRRIDSELRARDGGSHAAVRQLRVLHVQCMAINAIQLAIVVACVPRLL